MKDSMKMLASIVAGTVMIAILLILLIMEVIGVGVFVALTIVATVVMIIPVFTFKKRTITFDKKGISIVAPFVTMDIPFDRIDSIHTYENIGINLRTFGYSGIHVRCGNFISKELGDVTCAYDDRVPLKILIVSGKKKMVFNKGTLEETLELLNQLSEHTGKDIERSVGYVPTPEERASTKKKYKIAIGAVIGVTVAIVALVGIMMFIGSVDVTLTDTHVEIDATMMNEEIPYSDITLVELRSDIDYGTRTMGMSNSKVLIGSFDNDEFGRYRLAVYRDVSEAIVIHTADEIYVVNVDSSESTIRLFNELSSKV